MGKKWDHKQDFTEIWKECLRVLKPGAFAFIMNAPRSDCQLLLLTELANVGFNIEFTPIFWVYGTGFNKSGNMSKLIDNRLLNDWLKKRYNTTTTKVEKYFNKSIEKEKNDQKKDVLESKKEYWKKLIKKKWAKLEYNTEIKTKKYEHPGRKNRSYQTTSNVFSGDRKNDKIKNTRKSPFAGDHDGKWDDAQILNTLNTTDPVSPEAKEFSGSYAGFQPKPALEIVTVCMKKLSNKSYIDQALTNKHGVTFLDNGRIPYEELLDIPSKEAIKNAAKGYCGSGGTGVLGWNTGEQTSCKDSKKPPISAKKYEEMLKLKKKLVGGRLKQEKRWTYGDEKVDGYKTQDFDETDVSLKGRFPANLLVSDNVLDANLIKKDGHKRGIDQYDTESKSLFGKGNNTRKIQRHGDSGDFSRYFSLDMWWQEHIKELPKEIQKIFPFLYCPKASKAEKDKGLNRPLRTTEGMRKNAGPALVGKDYSKRTQLKNTHPTVKSITLMSYLIIIGSRKGDIILDPFGGSGTTAIACKMEDRKFIMIEKNREYYEIMKERLKSYKTQRKLI